MRSFQERLVVAFTHPRRVCREALAKRRERLRRAAFAARPSLLAWELSVLVDADEQSGSFSPSVHIGCARNDGGEVPPLDLTLFLVVADGDAGVHLVVQHALHIVGPAADVPLGRLTFPHGESMADAADWDWWLVLWGVGGEIARYRGSLAPAGELNDEAELALPEPAA